MKPRLARAQARLAAFNASRATNGHGPITMFGTISAEVEQRVRREIEQRHRRGSEIVLAINSPGGRVAPAEAIARDLQQVGKSLVLVDGLCASAAIRPLLAASHREARPGAQFLLHRTGLPADQVRDIANANDLRNMARWLDEDDAQLVAKLRQRTRLGERQPHLLREGDLVLNTLEALLGGVVDRISPGLDAADFRRFIEFERNRQRDRGAAR